MSKELTVPQQTFVQAILEGKNQSQAAKVAGVAQGTASVWFHNDEVQLAIQRGLRLNKNRIRLQAGKHIDGMLEVLIGAAYQKDAYSKTQVQAAALVLKYAGAESVDATEREGGAKLEVIINNNTSDNAHVEQQARYQRSIELRQPRADAAFELIEDDE